jgi:hypothetical protein
MRKFLAGMKNYRIWNLKKKRSILSMGSALDMGQKIRLGPNRIKFRFLCPMSRADPERMIYAWVSKAIAAIVFSLILMYPS